MSRATVDPSRRNILTILGVTTAGTTVLSTDALGDDKFVGDSYGVPPYAKASPELQERVAAALDNIAKAIRSGEITATKLNVNSALELNSWIQHDILITVEIPVNRYPPLPPTALGD